MLIAENVRWDKEGKFMATIDKYLECCTDERFITAKQAILGLEKILGLTKVYDEKIKHQFDNLLLEKYKENQQKLLNKDLANMLKILKNAPSV